MKKMDAYRSHAYFTGLLFITATAAGGISLFFLGPLQTQDYLATLYPAGIQLLTGVLFIVIMVVAVAAIPVVVFPVIKKHNEPLAIGYIVFRSLEAAAGLALVISWLLLLALSRLYTEAGMPDEGSYSLAGRLFMSANDGINTVMAVIFSIGALMFYHILYYSRLIPRFLSVWGLLAALLYLTSGLLLFYTVIEPDSPLQVALMLPVALQEIVMALWLIVKGFNPQLAAAEPQ